VSFFNYNGRKVYYSEQGKGEPLILLHGNTSCGMMFNPIVPKLSEIYRVIVIDFLGGGRSDRLETWPSDLWYDWAMQVKSLCDRLELDSVNIIGTSGGALATINAALEYPELVNRVIADSFEGIKADPGITDQIRIGRAQAKHFEGFVQYLQMLHGDDWEQVFDCDTDAVLRHASETGAFFHKPLSDLKVMMLLTGSMEDDMFPKGHCKALFEMICAETKYAEKHIFDHGGHPSMMSNQDEFVKLCEEFFG